MRHPKIILIQVFVGIVLLCIMGIPVGVVLILVAFAAFAAYYIAFPLYRRRSLLIVGCVAAPIAFYLIGVERALTRHRTALIKRDDYVAIAQGCLELLRKHGSEEFVSFSSTDTNLPLVIRSVRPMSVSVGSNRVTIMKTGGHYHMGLLFRQSTTNSNVFELVFQEEKKGSRDLLLYSVAR